MFTKTKYNFTNMSMNVKSAESFIKLGVNIEHSIRREYYKRRGCRRYEKVASKISGEGSVSEKVKYRRGTRGEKSVARDAKFGLRNPVFNANFVIHRAGGREISRVSL